MVRYNIVDLHLIREDKITMRKRMQGIKRCLAFLLIFVMMGSSILVSAEDKTEESNTTNTITETKEETDESTESKETERKESVESSVEETLEEASETLTPESFNEPQPRWTEKNSWRILLSRMEV